jgi:hypothetical protein
MNQDANTLDRGVLPVTTPVDAVRDELERVLAGPDFRGSERAGRFLRFVVEETLEGRAGRLKAYTIATELLGRSQDFDPVTDPIVRTQASRVRRSLEHYYLTGGALDPVRIDMPAGSYRPVFSAPPTYRKDVSSPSSPDEDDFLTEPIIAVLPFADSTPEGSQASFVHELAQEVAVALARFEGFRVLPPSAWQAADDTPGLRGTTWPGDWPPAFFSEEAQVTPGNGLRSPWCCMRPRQAKCCGLCRSCACCGRRTSTWCDARSAAGWPAR